MTITILTGCALSLLASLPDQSVNTCVTSPPYWGLRDYGQGAQLGLEASPEEYVANMAKVFREVRRVLRDDGTLWLNLGDSYSGNAGGNQGKNGQRSDRAFTAHIADKLGACLKPKDLVGIPWRVALALQADGWYLRSDIIWSKPNSMPESVTDRPTKSHEYLFLLSKQERYYYDAAAIEEPAKWERWGYQTERKAHTGTAGHLGGKSLAELPIRNKKNKRSVWTVATKPFSEAHFATYPPELIEPCILAGCPAGGTVLDPFFGAGTTGLVADRHGRHCVGIELNSDYVKLAEKRLRKDAGMFADIVVAA